MNTSDLRRVLQELADEPIEIGTNVAAARSRGRRILRLRRTAAVTGSVLAVGSVVAGVALARTDGSTAAPQPAVLATTRPGNGPFAAKAVFGWLPAGWKVMDSQVGDPQAAAAESGSSTEGQGGLAPARRNAFSMFAQGPAGGGVHQVSFTLFAPGQEPELGYMRGAAQARPVPAKPVAGHPAHWLQPPPPGPGTAPGEARLRIKYGPNQWAEIEVDDVPGHDVSALLYRIAENIRLGTFPMAMPIRLTGLAKTFRAADYQAIDPAQAGSAGWSVVLTFTPGLTITINPQGGNRTYAKGHRTPNTTVDGHPATHLTGTPDTLSGIRLAGPHPTPTTQPGEILCIYQVDGLDICYQATAPARTALRPSGGLAALYHHTTIFGRNGSTWTTQPVG